MTIKTQYNRNQKVWIVIDRGRSRDDYELVRGEIKEITIKTPKTDYGRCDIFYKVIYDNGNSFAIVHELQVYDSQKQYHNKMAEICESFLKK